VRKWPIKPDISTIVSENLYFKPIKNAKMRKKREKRKDFILTTSGGITGNENVFLWHKCSVETLLHGRVF
jgi:hypothetical protein